MFNGQISHLQKLACVVLGLAAVIFLWTCTLWANLVPSVLLPWPSDVGKALVTMLESPKFWHDLSGTVWTWLAGVVIGSLIGAFLGVVLGLNRFVWAAVEPWVEFIRSLPSVVLIPLVSLFMGVGFSSRLTASAIVVVVLMMATSGTAIRSTSAAHLRLATAWRATAAQRLIHFQLPAALSHMVVALKAAIPIALIVAVAADMLIATEAGIGKIIMDSLAVFDTARMYAAVLVVGFLGYIASMVGLKIEVWALHWSGK
ncbi:MAG: ABC transporter permease subunit [Candidatus Thiodiazotropha sp.]